MRNMKKLLQKAMVFTLSAAMLVGTPMTASAAGLVDLYSISDGTGTVNKDGTPTGTVTNTDTNTGALIKGYRAEIVGIALDRETVSAEAGTSETLKATVMLNSEIKDENGVDHAPEVVEELSKKIKWEVLYLDENGNKEGLNAPNPAEKVAIEGKADNRSEITLNPQQGTEKGKEVTVRATIDASYYFESDGDVDVVEGENNKQKDETINWDNWKNESEKYIIQDPERAGLIYTADAKVSVKEYTDKLSWKDTEAAAKDDDTLIVKHTTDLDAILVRDPETANDAITWVSDTPKYATVSAAGVVTAKKDTPENTTVKITAVSERGAVATRSFTIDAGVKADVVKVFVTGLDGDQTGKTIEKDIAEAANRSMQVSAKMYAKVTAYATGTGKAAVAVPVADGNKTVGNTLDTATLPEGAKATPNVEVENDGWYVDANGKVQQVKITDKITWSSSKPAFATVDASGNVTLKTVGTAAITAKATNGKSAKTNVKVVASLKKLTIGGVVSGGTYDSGTTLNLVAVRNDGEMTDINKDAVKWSIAKVNNQVNKNATINAKGVLKISNKVDEAVDVTIHLEATKAKNADGELIKADDVTIHVKQGDVDVITVTDSNNIIVARGGFGTDNKKLTARTDLTAVSKTDEINVPLEKAYTATAQRVVTGENDAVELATADASTLTWKTSNAKIATITATGASATIRAVGAGTATITVSGVRVNEKNAASTLNVTFKVKVKQPVTTLTMNKPTVTLAQKDKIVRKEVVGQQDQTVSLKVAFGPKNAEKSQTKIASWTVQQIAGIGAGDTVTPVEVKGKPVTATSASVKLIGPKAGDTYKITAKSITGATATSTVTIVAPTKEVWIADSVDQNGTPVRFSTPGKNDAPVYNTAKLVIGTGNKITMKPYINTGDLSTKKDGAPVWSEAGENHTESVTYTVNKKGIVTIDQDGNVYPVKAGVVTITAKTPTGKKATLKVTVTVQ